jgi:hypothetical protein
VLPGREMDVSRLLVRPLSTEWSRRPKLKPAATRLIVLLANAAASAPDDTSGDDGTDMCNPCSRDASEVVAVAIEVEIGADAMEGA